VTSAPAAGGAAKVPAWRQRQEEEKKLREEAQKKQEEEKKMKVEAEKERLLKEKKEKEEAQKKQAAVAAAPKSAGTIPAWKKNSTGAAKPAPAAAKPAPTLTVAKATPTTAKAAPAPSVAPRRKRHSKIGMDLTEIQGSLNSLDIEGIEVKKSPKSGLTTSQVERAAGGGSRGAPKPVSTAPASSGATLAPKKSGGIANRWQQSLQEKKENEHNAERQKIRERRGRATAFVDKEIRRLIDVLQKKPGRKCTFGELFKETQETFSALSATLAVARKRKVVHFEGQAMLAQGAHDNVVITLLRDSIEDSQAFVSVYNAPPTNPGPQKPTSNKCTECNKTVYPNERIAPNDVLLHKTCFKCVTCKCQLKLAKYARNNGKFYCEPHFKQAMQSSGTYNF